MAFSFERRGNVLVLSVTEPKVEGMPRCLTAIQRRLDEGGITELHLQLDDDAWDLQWVKNGLTALETNLRDRGISLRVLGRDARVPPAGVPAAGEPPTAPARRHVSPAGSSGRA